MKKITFLFVNFLLIAPNLLKGQQLTTSKHIDSNYFCYGYYITNDSQKTEATFLINSNPLLTDAQRVQKLQYSITVLQKDSSLKVFKPREIKGYRINNWGRIKLGPTDDSRLWPYLMNRMANITSRPMEFHSICIFNKLYMNPPPEYLAWCFVSGEQKGNYVYSYNWFSSGQGKSAYRSYYLSIWPFKYNPSTKRAYGIMFNNNLSRFFADDTLLSDLIHKRYLLANWDTAIMFSEYARWKTKQLHLKLHTSLDTAFLKFYPTAESDTSYALKAVIDAHKRYRNRGIFWISALLTATLTPISVVPYGFLVMKTRPKFSKNLLQDSALISNQMYSETYIKQAKKLKWNELVNGTSLGCLLFTVFVYEIVNYQNTH